MVRRALRSLQTLGGPFCAIGYTHHCRNLTEPTDPRHLHSFSFEGQGSSGFSTARSHDFAWVFAWAGLSAAFGSQQLLTNLQSKLRSWRVASMPSHAMCKLMACSDARKPSFQPNVADVIFDQQNVHGSNMGACF
jgi:hypothetical protein